MILNEVVAKKSNTVDKCQKRGRALSILLEDLAVWFPYPYYDVEAMVFEETKRFKAQRSSKIYSSDLPAKRNANKKPLGKLKAGEVVLST
jgi:hypothetical protein